MNSKKNEHNMKVAHFSPRDFFSCLPHVNCMKTLFTGLHKFHFPTDVNHHQKVGGAILLSQISICWILSHTYPMVSWASPKNRPRRMLWASVRRSSITTNQVLTYWTSVLYLSLSTKTWTLLLNNICSTNMGCWETMGLK